MSQTSDVRTLGLLRATGVGVGAIVGGGILLLVGVAFQATGPSAILAFALNGAVAFLTVLSFAEVSTSFPESGGAYVFAKKVLGVRAAFGVGWVLWFAYIVAGVLYAIGFAEFAAAAGRELWPLVGTGPPPAWLSSRREVIVVALLAAGAYAGSLTRRASGGGELATVGKVILFCALIAVGAWALTDRPLAVVESDLTPFLPFGATGLLAAMGATFIALQGFDLIAAVAGEVRDPERTIPRAMGLSLAIALAIYLPLLLVVATVGTPPDVSIVTMSERNPATVMADAARNFMGPVGYWIVLIAALLSTLSALHANLLAASRVALTMARDRTLPRVLARLHAVRGTPGVAIYATYVALAATVIIIPDLGQAGAAASLIFLLSFALVHGTAYLARRRAPEAPPFCTPAFPLVPVTGGLACGALALYQAAAVPAAGGIVALWLALGGLLYFAVFAGRAEAVDAATQARDPALTRLRGRQPLVLVPIANPQSAPGLVAIASALAPEGTGKVVLLTVLRRDGDTPSAERLSEAQRVVSEALSASFAAGQAPEVLITTAADVWEEIARVARVHACESLVLGLSELESVRGGQLEQLLNRVDCEVVVARVPPEFRLEQVETVLVPIGGRGGHDAIRARLLGSLTRGSHPRHVCFCSIVGHEAPQATQEQHRRRLDAIADDEAATASSTEVLRGDEVVDVLAERGRACDLVVLGLQRHRGETLFGEVALRVAGAMPTATLMISRKS